MNALRPSEFEAVRRLLYCETGIVLEADKAYLVETRLAPLVRANGAACVSELLDVVYRGETPLLRRKIVEALANGETQFFRDRAAFDMLRTHLLPKLIAARTATRTLVIWSAACSTGQEPYSIALLLNEYFPELAGWDVRIVATDFSEEHLARAQAGRYSDYEISRGLPKALLARWFHRQGEDWVIESVVRERVQFMPMNLVRTWPQVFLVDLVLLRNVMIYWDVATKRSVLERTREVLLPHGALVLGAAETTLRIDERYERVAVGSACYYVDACGTHRSGG